ncbi:EAL domain-containing protein [Luteimonas sp. RD2P54]|uniref:EAL domain-containing protein n=1 Tax=Luteimonas endophytica TaxID=3042023 RepID=A0ABT6J7R8_9GAMM|nr:EAL domain-containing protein [Luteimonas endophytica]MDH5822867.1 EAL domain-containing protein [Luteimonas endophytica]
MTGKAGCSACRDGRDLPLAITMAFQPIVDLSNRTVFAHEALVRGRGGETAAQVLALIDADRLYAFDQACRVTAIRQAAMLGMPTVLSINFMPNAVYRPEHCLRSTLAAAERAAWPLTRILFEVTEQEKVVDAGHLLEILTTYRARGLLTAIDDFGAGHSGLNLLAEFQPDLVKLDMDLVRGIDRDRPRRVIVDHAARMCTDLGIRIVAEGVETAAEHRALLDLGIVLQQGYLFARPLVEGLPPVAWPAPGGAPERVDASIA